MEMNCRPSVYRQYFTRFFTSPILPAFCALLLVACGGPAGDSSGTTGNSAAISGTSAGVSTTTTNTGDTTRPAVAITSPTSASTYTASGATLNLGGTASDNVGVTQVRWANSLGGTGTASGTTSWAVTGLALQQGQNIITVTAYDAAGNTAVASFTANYTAPSTGDTTKPSVSITSPTSASTYTASGATINLGGTASDNVGVTQIRWTNSLGGTGTASGTTSWAVTGLALQQGQNIITVTAYDAAGNTAAVSFIVYYNVTAGNTYYVATTGNDQTGNGSSASPWGTIGYGVSRLASGDTLIVKKGVYTTRGDFITGVPSGTPARYTLIMAEAPMEVRIQSTASLDYNENQLNLGGSYIKVDGFIFDMASTYYPEHIGTVPGSFNKITRCIFKRSGSMTEYGGLLVVRGNDNLIEDVAGTGACRYCFEAGSPDATTQRNIWRRVVGRFDYSNSKQPKATFATYGNNNTTDVRDHLYQNVLVIDGQNPGNFGTGEQKYGGMYMPKNATNVRLQGTIVLNEGVGYSGLFNREWGSGNTASHTVVWDLNGSSGGVSGVRASSADSLTVGGNVAGSAYDLTNGAPANSLLKPATKPANLLNNSPGAIVLKRYGVSGTLWGETGYDQLTSEDLWPWPYEDKIKAVFAEPNASPSGNSPATNNTKRGFAADGNGLYGGPITLTSYIWEYLGTSCPTTVCK